MSLRVVRRKGTKTLYIRGTVRGIRCYEATGTESRALAEAYRAKRETQLFEGALVGRRVAVSFGEAALSYLEFEPRSERTEYDVQRLIDYFGPDRPLHVVITQDAADAAVRAMLGIYAAPGGKRRAVYAPLTAILNHAHARGWCDKPGFQMPALPRGKTRWLTPAEALRLVDAAAPHLRPLLLFILCTGARLSEALYLDWADVDLPAAKAVFRDVKARTGHEHDRAAALPEAAVLLLANLPGEKVEIAPGEFTYIKRGAVFRTDDGSPYADTGRQFGGQIKTGFRTARVRAQLRDLSPHDLRHTFASYLYALTKDLLLVKHEGGWQSTAMVERYSHLLPSHLVPEIRKVWGNSHPRVGLLPGADRERHTKTATA